jgi:CBS domain-containing protein
MIANQVRRCTVHRRRGESQVSFEAQPAISTRESPRTYADRIPRVEVMSRDLVCARPDLEVSPVISWMVRNHDGCIPVVDDRRHPLGVITKFDLVEHLDATIQSTPNESPFPADLAARDADEVMMPIALALDENATVAHAAAMMALEDTHHVMVVRSTGELVGVVSAKDIVKWLVTNDRLTAPPFEQGA